MLIKGRAPAGSAFRRGHERTLKQDSALHLRHLWFLPFLRLRASA